MQVMTLTWSLAVQAQHPSLLQNFQEFETQAAGKRVAVFLDYDGAPLFPMCLCSAPTCTRDILYEAPDKTRAMSGSPVLVRRNK